MIKLADTHITFSSIEGTPVAFHENWLWWHLRIVWNARTNRKIHRNSFNYFFTLFHFAMDDPIEKWNLFSFQFYCDNAPTVKKI